MRAFKFATGRSYAVVIGFPEGEDPRLMWGNMGTLQQIWVIVVGGMWGLRFMMTRLSGKVWGLCYWWTERTLEQVVFSLNQWQDGGGQEEYVLKSIVFFCLSNRPSVKYLYLLAGISKFWIPLCIIIILLLEVIVRGQQVLIISSSVINICRYIYICHLSGQT